MHPHRLCVLALLSACSGGVTNERSGGTTEDDAPSGVADIQVEVASYDFGELAVGDKAEALIAVANLGGAELIISAIDVDEPFSVTPESNTVAAGGTFQLTVRAIPTEYADAAADILISSNDDDEAEVTIALTLAVLVDHDGDGHDLIAAGGDDCDDEDATAYPGAPEQWYDGTDQNCDGLSDYDQDGDGYEAETDDNRPDEPDCQDRDPTFHPGAPDEPYDGADTNCDEADDFDYDGDGSKSSDYGKGLDCNDDDPEVNASGTEQLNGEDDDCNGDYDDNAEVEHSDFIYDAEGSYDRVGYSMAIGDLDNDGMAEVIVGAPYASASNPSANGRGGVGVFLGGASLRSTGTNIDKADNFIEGAGSSDLFGAQLAVLGDWDGDGVNDLAMQAAAISSNSGTVYILGGEDAAKRGDTNDAIATFTGSTNYSLGRGLGTDIDLDGDGLHDLLAMYTTGGNAAALAYGGDGGSMGIGSMDALWSVSGSETAFYRNAPVGGDFDGDGLDDIVMSDGSADSYGTDSGSVWAVWGRTSRYSGNAGIDSVATTIVHGDSSSDGWGWATQLAGDWDADGDDEIWIYNAGGDALYLVNGGSQSPFDPTTTYTAAYDWGSYSDAEMIRQLGDWSGDGLTDIIVFLEDSSGYYGQMLLFSSELNDPTMAYEAKEHKIGYGKGSTDHEDADGEAVDEDDNGNAGYGMAARGADIDGDGKDDFAVGDPEFRSNAGEAYVLINAHTD